ncbi:hypothetical protein [Streptomyces sp. NPDC002491]
MFAGTGPRHGGRRPANAAGRTVAYLNRGGPGTVCRTSAGGQSRTDEYAPVPFLVGAVVLLGAGFLVFVALHRRSRGTG